ncbi:MAG: hypothetical protein R2851_07415 [Caldilineaceae bacterium]
MLGSLLALNLQVRRAIRAAMGCVLFILLGWYTNHGNQVASFALTFGVASLLVVLGTASVELLHHVPWPRPLVFLGDASYSIYLTHVMFFNVFLMGATVLGQLVRIDSTVLMWSMLIGAVAGGCVVYLYLEKPLIALLRRKLVSRRKTVLVAPESVRPNSKFSDL